MRASVVIAGFASAGTLALSGCEKATAVTIDSTTTPAAKTYPARLQFFNGPTPASTKPAPRGYNTYMVTPDQVGMTLTGITLLDASGAGATATVNCNITFAKAASGLSALRDCAFSAPAGTYTTLRLRFDPATQFLINDGLFSTTPSVSNGIVVGTPAGGAAPFTATVTVVEQTLKLPKSVGIVDSASSPTVGVIVDGIQYLQASDGGSFSPFATWTLPRMLAVIGQPTAVEYYVPDWLGSADAYCIEPYCARPAGISSITVAYIAGNTVAGVYMTFHKTPSCPTSTGITRVSDPRGYPGLDAGGNLGWAVATDTSWAHYNAAFRMTRVTSSGSTTLYCAGISADPSPAGGSYSSGAPNIATSGNSLGTFVLVAK